MAAREGALTSGGEKISSLQTTWKENGEDLRTYIAQWLEDAGPSPAGVARTAGRGQPAHLRSHGEDVRGGKIRIGFTGGASPPSPHLARRPTLS